MKKADVGAANDGKGTVPPWKTDVGCGKYNKDKLRCWERDFVRAESFVGFLMEVKMWNKREQMMVEMRY